MKSGEAVLGLGSRVPGTRVIRTRQGHGGSVTMLARAIGVAVVIAGCSHSRSILVLAMVPESGAPEERGMDRAMKTGE